MSNNNQKEWYKHGWGLVVAILLLPFFVIWYAWAKSKWSKNVKIGVTVASVVFMGIALASSPKTEQTAQQPAQQTQTKQEEQKPQQPQTPKPVAKYEGKIASYQAINPASLRFVAEVKNIGDAEGKFKCTVRGRDNSITYTGFDFFEDDSPLKPGETRTFNGVITIKKEGAVYVTEVTIDCK